MDLHEFHDLLLTGRARTASLRLRAAGLTAVQALAVLADCHSWPDEPGRLFPVRGLAGVATALSRAGVRWTVWIDDGTGPRAVRAWQEGSARA